MCPFPPLLLPSRLSPRCAQLAATLTMAIGYEAAADPRTEQLVALAQLAAWKLLELVLRRLAFHLALRASAAVRNPLARWLADGLAPELELA